MAQLLRSRRTEDDNFLADPRPQKSDGRPKKQSFFLFHELGEDSPGMTLEEVCTVEPSAVPTQLSLMVHLVGARVPGRATPEYLATMRRRKPDALKTAVIELTAHADKDDLVVYTFPILEDIKELLNTLADGEREGGAREVLRQLRNTLVNEGWKGYRSAAARKVVAETLQSLAEATTIRDECVKGLSAKLRSVSLNPVGVALPELSGDGDGEEEEVSG